MMTGEQRERERELFEEWFALHFGQGKRPHRSDQHDGYWYESTDRAWVAWLYRANLASADVQQAKPAPSECVHCEDVGWVWENGIEEQWQVPCPKHCAAAQTWMRDTGWLATSAESGTSPR